MGWEGPLTYRQLLVEDEWQDLQWDIPDRHDAYLQQVAYEVRRANAKHPNLVKLEDLRLKFLKAEETKLEADKEKKIAQVSAMSKAKWIGLVTRPGKPVIVKTAE